VAAEKVKLGELLGIALSFCISGEKLDLIMDPYFAYQNLRQLEVANPKFSKREDLLWYLLTVAGFMIVGFGILSFIPFFAPKHTSTQHLVYLPA